ncbi:MAG: hypothetical protein R3F53_03270 [Gammaproteobacteria bacterium]
MSTLVFHHPIYAEHQTGAGHPERSARIQAVERALRSPEFQALNWRSPPPAEFDQLTLLHAPAYVEQTLQAIPGDADRLHALDSDTIVSSGSGEACLRATGAVCSAIDAIVDGAADNAFARCGHQDIMRSRRRLWDFACSTVLLSAHAMPASNMAWNASR